VGSRFTVGGVPLGFVNSDRDPPPSLRMLCSKQDGFGGFIQKTSSLIVASAQQQSGMSSTGGKRFSDSILGNAVHTLYFDVVYLILRCSFCCVLHSFYYYDNVVRKTGVFVGEL
jgi:hypothetical protein